ncbi:hypothetical protein [Corynebacterium bovis]|uniref:hypothetical protein n=1 Tax=Corynebacterium bovis TaxID=36808 RepID=UPI00313A08F2
MLLRYATVWRDGKQQRYVADRVRDLFVAVSPAPVTCVEDLIPAAITLTGYEIKVVESGGLEPGVQATISRSQASLVTVTISTACTCRDFTLAHEIGHLVMRHRLGFCSETEVAKSMRGIYKHSHENLQEREAEFFARYVTWMMELGYGASMEEQWRWLYQLAL